MSSKAVIETENVEVNRQLNDVVVGKIVEMGCACATDLATQIGGGKSAQDMLGALDYLEKRGVLRRKEDKSDPRKYTQFQIVYELAR